MLRKERERERETKFACDVRYVSIHDGGQGATVVHESTGPHDTHEGERLRERGRQDA